MRVREIVSESSKPANEDACGARADGIWVIDGATALAEAPSVDGISAAAWLSRTASEILGALAWDGHTLPEILAATIERLADLGAGHGLAGPEFPTAAISVARQVGDRIEVCSLGDCSVWIAAAGEKPREIVDPRFAGSEAATLARVSELLRRGVAPRDAYREIRVDLQQRRRERNTPGGLWVLAANPEAARHAAVESVTAPPGSHVMVMSDGFSRVLWPFGLVADAAELCDRITSGRAGELLNELRVAEAADPNCSRVPRFGTHDDATMIWAEI